MVLAGRESPATGTVEGRVPSREEAIGKRRRGMMQEGPPPEAGEKVGYATIFASDPDAERQLNALRDAGCRQIFREILPGAWRQRPGLDRMLSTIKPGDTVVVWSLARLARSTRDLLDTIERIGGAGGEFRSLSESWASTAADAGKIVMSVFTGLADFERDSFRRRMKAGLKSAKRRGVQLGRPRKLKPEERQAACRLLAQGSSVRDVAKAFHVHQTTIYRLSNAQANHNVRPWPR